MVFDVDGDGDVVSIPLKKIVTSSVVSIEEEPDGDWASSVAESESFLSESDDEPSVDDKDDTGELGSTADNTDSNSSPMSEMQRYAAIENKLVYRWRRIVIVSILLTGAIVGGITFLTLNNEQKNDSSAAVSIGVQFFVACNNFPLRPLILPLIFVPHSSLYSRMPSMIPFNSVSKLYSQQIAVCHVK